jgi:hypothetical protein
LIKQAIYGEKKRDINSMVRKIEERYFSPEEKRQVTLLLKNERPVVRVDFLLGRKIPIIGAAADQGPMAVCKVIKIYFREFLYDFALKRDKPPEVFRSFLKGRACCLDNADQLQISQGV